MSEEVIERVLLDKDFSELFVISNRGGDFYIEHRAQMRIDLLWIIRNLDRFIDMGLL